MAANVSIKSVIPEAQEILAESSQLMGVFRDVSKYAIKGASTVSYPKVTARSGQSKSLTASFTQNDAAYGEDSIALSTVLGDAFGVNLHQEEQNVLNALEDSTRETLRAMGMKADEAIYAALLAATTTAVAPTADMYADVVDLAKDLDLAKVPASDRFLLVSPADYAKLLKTKDFVRFDGVGNGAIIASGKVGMILGFTVVKSNTITTSIACHKNAMAWAIQGDIKMVVQPDALGHKNIYSISEIFGCSATQAGNWSVKLSA